MTTNHRQFGSAALLAAFAAALAGCANGPKDKPGTSSPNQANPAVRDLPAATKKPATPERDPSIAEVMQMREQNVLGVVGLYDPFNPWIWNPEQTQIRGIKVGALYLLGPDSTGVFGDGVIKPRLLGAYRDENGKIDYKVIKEWSFDVQQAMPFRAFRRKRWGWGYGLFLNWGDMNLAGKDIRLIISFERADGVVITGSKKDWRVPTQAEKK